MERHRIIPLLFVLCLLGARVASAQDARTFGVTMGYPATVGVLWHVNDKLAVRNRFGTRSGVGVVVYF